LNSTFPPRGYGLSTTEMNLPWNAIALVSLILVIALGSVVVVALWLNGRRNRRKMPVRLPRRRLEPERHPVPSRDPQPTSEDHDLVEEFFRSLDKR
jgi:hypothetical protein